MTLSQGQVINERYRVVRLLGQGGFGAVYRGWDLNLNKPVAIKENLDTSLEAQKQFQHEAQILSNLRHTNLPTVTDHFFIPGLGQYLIMDYIEGDDLQAILDKNGPLPQAQVLPWIEQVCDALEYLHAQNPPIIHRDIKPANIKITPQGKAVLVDFGISKVYDPQLKTTVGARAVTPGYSPPEQYGQGQTDQRSDVYALGATLYTLVTGYSPPESVERLTRNTPLPPPHQLAPSISPTVEAAILHACEPTTTYRLPSVTAFRQALRAPASTPLPPVLPPSAPLVMPPQSMPERSRVSTRPPEQPAARRPPWLLLGAVGAGLVAVLALIVIIVAGNSTSKVAAPASTIAPTTASVSAALDTAEPTTAARPTATRRAATPTSTALPDGVLFTDDFASVATSEELGWDTTNTDHVEYMWSSGELKVNVNESMTLGLNVLPDSYTDFAVEVEAQPTSDAYAEYGLILRYTYDKNADVKTYYLFGISTDGDYFLWKRLNGEWSDPDLIEYTTSDYVKAGRAKNTLGVRVEGDQLMLYINGFPVETYTDDSIAQGRVGLVVGAGDTLPAEVAFSRFTVLTADKAKAEWGEAPASSPTQAPAARPTSTPRSAPTAPAATAAPVRTGRTTITVRSTFDQTCRIVLWGPADVTLDAGKNNPVTREVVPGTYGWRAFVGGAETGQADNLVVRSGASCSFVCDASQQRIRWGCN
jgi:serine/threonine protein kinase